MNAKQRAAMERLQNGEWIENYREGGNSMVPLIYSKQPVTLAPVNPELLEKGDMVFCKVRGNVYTHKVLGKKPGQVQIGNNHGRVNGWTSYANVWGIVVEVEGREVGGARAKVRAHPS